MGLGHDLSCSKVSQAFASIFGGSYILGLGLAQFRFRIRVSIGGRVRVSF